ncbi:hypothetical protein IKO50_00835 [bacterium]|nr:hypothetical protein [bacterium]
MDDKQEVLYGMRFVDRNNMETTVNKMYMKNNSLYITPNPVVVNELSV